MITGVGDRDRGDSDSEFRLVNFILQCGRRKTTNNIEYKIRCSQCGWSEARPRYPISNSDFSRYDIGNDMTMMTSTIDNHSSHCHNKAVEDETHDLNLKLLPTRTFTMVGPNIFTASNVFQAAMRNAALRVNSLML